MQRHLNKAGTADGVLDDSQLSQRRKRVAGIGVKARVERDVVVRRIKTCMIEQIEKVRLVLERKSFGQLRLFEYREVHPGLEWTAEDVTSIVGESVLNSIAKSLRTRRGRAARGHAILSRRYVVERILA
jgi:hypothetical protein